MALGPRQSGWWVGILGSLHYLGVRLIVSVPFCFVPFIHSFTGVYFSVVSAVGTQVAQWEDFTEEMVLFILDLKNKYDSAPPPFYSLLSRWQSLTMITCWVRTVNSDLQDST